MLQQTLLILGLFCPAVSLVTLILAVEKKWRTGRNCSAVLIPFIGPVLLSIWILLAGHPRWWITAAWLGDIGTLVFLVAMPRIVQDLLGLRSGLVDKK